jgi:hypothetical protein
MTVLLLVILAVIFETFCLAASIRAAFALKRLGKVV